MNSNVGKMSVAVIIPTFNREHTILKALDSVFAQTVAPDEIIVIDDGSSDKTIERLLPLIDAGKIQYHLTPHRGVSHARNFGFKQSHSDWICFLDSDDEWLNIKLAEQIKYAKEHPHIFLIHTDEIWVRNGVRVNPMRKHKKYGGRIFKHCLPLCLISPSSVMVHRDLLLKNKGFREDFPVCEDYDLWLKITSEYEVGFIEQPLIKKYGGHEDQLSRSLKAMDYYRVKSMDWIFDHRWLNFDEEASIKEEILKKTTILLEGYEKHQNEDHVAEIKDLHQKYCQLLNASLGASAQPTL
jgi:glycosyltransferase involved in cell wall biosynthesis